MCAWARNQQKLASANVKAEIPSLKNIQEALVAMGDKSPSFVESREWIGSFEVAICMDYFVEVKTSLHYALCNIVVIRV